MDRRPRQGAPVSTRFLPYVDPADCTPEAIAVAAADVLACLRTVILEERPADADAAITMLDRIHHFTRRLEDLALLIHAEPFTQSELAAVTGVTRQAIHDRLRTARQRLAPVLAYHIPAD
jgi:DNA-directed RNA polymerase specialized sigma24 family protein